MENRMEIEKCVGNCVLWMDARNVNASFRADVAPMEVDLSTARATGSAPGALVEKRDLPVLASSDDDSISELSDIQFLGTTREMAHFMLFVHHSDLSATNLFVAVSAHQAQDKALQQAQLEKDDALDRLSRTKDELEAALQDLQRYRESVSTITRLSSTTTRENLHLKALCEEKTRRLAQAEEELHDTHSMLVAARASEAELTSMNRKHEATIKALEERKKALEDKGRFAVKGAVARSFLCSLCCATFRLEIRHTAMYID